MASEARISVDVSAVNDLLRRLSVTDREAKTAIKGALRESILLMRESVREGAAKVTSRRGKVRKGILVHVYKNASGANISIQKSFTYPKSPRWFALHLLERGTKSGPTWKKVRYRADGSVWKHGKTPEKPFFSASVEAGRNKASSVLQENILKMIQLRVDKRK